MAENIVELLTDVADAIREKKGSTEKINAQRFADEIKNLPSGGGSLNFDAVLFNEATIGNNNYKVLRIKEGVKSLESGAINNWKGLEELYVSSSVNSVSISTTTGCTALTKIVVAEGNPTFDSRDSCNAIIKTSTSELVCGCKSTIIPSGIILIGYGAFQSIDTLTHLDIPEGVTKLAAYSFYGCKGLTELVFPNSIAELQVYSLGVLSSMKKLDFTKCTSIPILAANAIYNFPNTGRIVVPDTLYDSWIAATNWSTLAGRIVKSSEYTE